MTATGPYRQGTRRKRIDWGGYAKVAMYAVIITAFIIGYVTR